MYPSVPFARLGLTQYFAQIAAQIPCLIMITKSGKIYLICCIFPIISTIHSFWSNKASLTINNFKYQRRKCIWLQILFHLRFCSYSIIFMSKPSSLGVKPFLGKQLHHALWKILLFFFGTLPLEMGWYSLLNTYCGTINKPININLKKLRERWIIMPSF